MSQVADLYEVMTSGWCDRGVLLSNALADSAGTRTMLEQAHALGLEVLVEYDMGYHPRGGDYVSGVSEPWTYLVQDGQRIQVADSWQTLFEWVRRQKDKA
jgi:hypothetical protein